MKLRIPRPDRAPRIRSVEAAATQIPEQSQFHVFEEFPDLDSGKLIHAINSGAIIGGAGRTKFIDALAILYPETKDQIKPHVLNALHRRSQQSLNSHFREYCESTTSAIMLAPERKNELDRDTAWLWLCSKLTKGIIDANDYAEIMITALLLFPDRRAELPIDDRLWNALTDVIEGCRNPRNWLGFATTCMQATILFPDRKQDLNITEAEWSGIKRKTTANKKSKSTLYKMAMCAAVIAADEVSITDDGIVIKHPEKNLGDTPNLPARNMAR